MPNLLLHIALITLLCLPSALKAEQLHVAVAANFRASLEHILLQFPDRDGVLISSGSSGTLFAQIVHGAPFDILLAADSDYPQRLVDKGLARPDSLRTYAIGALNLVYQHEVAPNGNASLDTLLADDSLSIATANPRLAPYGQAAQQVLNRYARSKPQILGANIGHAYQLWYSGAVDMALVARSQAGDQGIPIPSSWHAPLRQQAVILAATQNRAFADRFLAWLMAESTQAQITALGYPKEQKS